MQVDVSGTRFEFPHPCACCGGKANARLGVAATKSTGKKVVHTRTNTWDFPYCDACLGHVRAAEAAASLAFTLAVSSVVAGVALWFFVIPYVGILATVLGLAGRTYLYSKQMTAARSMMRKSECACVGRAVSYLNWHGSLHQFWFVSLDYALAFMLANQRKLVNLSHEAIELMESGGQVPPAAGPRAPRRHRS